ncbi:MAG: DUF6600 domain-containing protein, partial [Pseudolabrys sp.]
MRSSSIVRGVTIAALTGAAVLTASALLPRDFGIASVALAQPADIGDFHRGLEPFGMWQNDPRRGEVWVPFKKPRGWRPYTVGHWVYTDDWGWYWISDDDEQDWGWITYHYGRWVFERPLGWVWVPGEEWAPAWVNWRNGDNAVGWAALPPDDVVEAYDDNPVYWTFVQPRYLIVSRPREYYLEGPRREVVFSRTVVVNRTVSVSNNRLAVNPGVAPSLIASVSRAPVPTFRVRPRVLASTQGVTGAVSVRREELGHRGNGPPNRAGRGGRPVVASVNAVSVVRTTTIVRPTATPVVAPQPLAKGERGRLGSQPPRAAQGQGISPAAAPSTAPAAPTGPRAPNGAPPSPSAPAAPRAPNAAPSAPPAAAPPAAGTPRVGPTTAPP